MARSEDYTQGRRARRPYDDQDIADRRAQPTLSADPPTQGRRAGTSYAPQFDRYVSEPPAPPARAAAPAAPRTGRPDPRQAQAGYGYEQAPQAQATGWDQSYQDPQEEAWAQQTQNARPAFGTRPRAAAQPAQQTYDPRAPQRGYDYEQQQGGYTQPQGQGYGYADPQAGYAQDGYAQADAGGYPQGHDQYAQGYAEPQHGQYPQGQHGYHPQQGYEQQPQDYQQGYGDPNYQGDDQILANGEYAEADVGVAPPPPTRSRRGLVVAGAFVAAVLIGGGLGFVYKMTSESSFASTTGEPPLLAADEDPTKTIPEETATAEGDKSIYDRVSGGEGESTDGSSTVTLGESAESVDVPKEGEADVVDTQPLGLSFPEDSPASGDETATVTGDEPAGTVEATNGEVQPKLRKVKVLKVGTDGKINTADPGAGDIGGSDEGGQVEEAVDPAPAPEEAAPALDGEALTTQAPKKKKKKALTAAEQVAALADVEPAAAPATASAATSSGASGTYVVQVGVANTSGEALGRFADLQQKHSDLLGSSQPEIQKTEKGHRLLVGPPTSKKSAAALCTKLKAAGQDCWVKQF